ncbi:palindromic element RPE4 domain-containing protein [Rickettsia amblyommatis]
MFSCFLDPVVKPWDDSPIRLKLLLYYGLK